MWLPRDTEPVTKLHLGSPVLYSPVLRTEPARNIQRDRADSLTATVRSCTVEYGRTGTPTDAERAHQPRQTPAAPSARGLQPGATRRRDRPELQLHRAHRARHTASGQSRGAGSPV